MISWSVCNIKKILFSMLILSGLTVSLFPQDKISGVINDYRHVTAIGPGANNVTLSNTDSIAPGDTVLLIQMQGVGIDITQDFYGIAVQSKFGEPGEHEFLLVQSVVDTIVTFTRNINTPFDVKGIVQLIRVPYYNSATVTGTLTAKSWDNTEKTGGVLAMIVGRKLKLDGEIDVSGKGFRGGSDTLGIGECVMTNQPVYNRDSYDETWLNAGYKGEGLAIHDELGTLLAPLHVKGQGINFTGGGGGNGKYSGGGGGSNRGKGGDGTNEKDFGPGACTSPYTGAYGGTTVKATVIKDGIFIGGGGGSSTHASGSTGSSGGNGGGLVIIIADTISGNRKTIKADGATAGNAISDAGAGGGGAGGSVILSLQSYSSVSDDSLKVSVKGGNGGTNPDNFGNGGGGGGGLLWVSTPSIPGKVITRINYGIPAPATATEGDGEIKYSFSPKLNGFLFNLISSEVTGNNVDSICSNVAFGIIKGTKPVGGTLPYNILWESSIISESAGFAAAPGTNNLQDYSPPGLLTQTTWFRRVVSDNGAPVITDISIPVKIIVQQAITGNLVGKDTTICYNQNPLSLVPLNSGPANGSAFNYYKYKWIQNLTNTGWSTSPVAAGTATNNSYDPPALTDTTYYQRVVTSGRCVDHSTTVTITVLPLITGNITARPDSVICEGSLFNTLGASAPGEGDLINYWYQWQDSITTGSWVPAPNTNVGSAYTADTSKFSTVENRYFRRIVFSGPDSVCRNNSSPIKLTRYHKIKTNSISADQTICSGSAPLALSGSTPIQGSGVYTYTWQDSSKVSSWMTKGTTDFSFSPAALTDTTWYRRIINSSKCTNVSSSVRINVHKPILNNYITLLAGGLTDTTICNGAVPHLLKGTVPTGGTNIPGDYAYLWFVSTDNTGAGTGVSYQPPALVAGTYYYKRQVSSGACLLPKESSATITVTVLPSITNNVISGKTTVCYNTVPALLTGLLLSGGNGTYSYFWEQSTDGVTWASAAGTNNSSSDYQPPALTIPMKYRRTVKSGATDCCIDTSGVFNLGIAPLPTGTINSIADTTICEGSKVRLNISLSGASKWKVIYLENSAQITVNNISGTDTTLLISPVTGTALSTFNYSLFSVEDKNGCLATLLTGARKADVYKVPVANAGPDTDTCGPKFNLKATPSYGTGIWYYPTAVVASTANNPSVTITIDSTFAGANVSHKFYWEEINWQCKSKDSVVIRFDKRVTKVSAGPADTTIYSFDNIFHLGADPVSNSWETGGWSVINGTGNFDDSSKINAVVSDLSKGLNTFLWTVRNGVCKLQDKIDINVTGLEIPQGFSPNNDQINDIFIIKGLDLSNQDAELKIVNGAGAEVFSTSNLNCPDCWKDWDGKNSRGLDLPEGTYYYLLKITSDPKNGGNGQVFKKSGFIVLKRY